MTAYKKTPISALKGLPPQDKEAVHRIFEQEWKSFRHKVMVLDDDPTGIQTVHDICVYTDWSVESIRKGMRGKDQMFFVLTDSRSLSREETVRIHREIAGNVKKAGLQCGGRPLLVSRGDSTLRGHYPLEAEILKQEMEKGTEEKYDGQILCPFFQEGKRFTIDSVHYVQEGEWLVPVGETEFAKDASFGYRSSHLGEYVEEKSRGRYAARDGIYITISQLRKPAYEEITQKLCSAENFQLIAVDAVDQSDIEVFAACLFRAMRRGKNYMIRCGAALPKVLGNISDRPLLTAGELVAGTGGFGGMVVVGSHVRKTTQQLEYLRSRSRRTEFLEFDVNRYFEENGLEREKERIVQRAQAVMKEGNTAVVYTSRRVLAPEEMDGEDKLRLSAAISEAVTGVVAGISSRPAFLIAKGGITSSDIGVKALGVKRALALGQALPGVPVWRLGEESRFPGLSYIIFPGNVGDTDALYQLVRMLREQEEL